MWTLSSDLKESLKISDDNSIQRLLRRALKFFHKVGRPTLIGPISLDMGISLRQLELLIGVLVQAGDIRQATQDEMDHFGISGDAAAYALTTEPSVNIAHD